VKLQFTDEELTHLPAVWEVKLYLFVKSTAFWELASKGGLFDLKKQTIRSARVGRVLSRTAEERNISRKNGYRERIFVGYRYRNMNMNVACSIKFLG
jgi:hypothetical protein